LGLLLLHAGAVADAIGLAILVSVFLLQIRGQRSGKKGWDAVRKDGTLVQKQLFPWLTRRRRGIGAAEKEVYGNSENNQNLIVGINKLSLNQRPALPHFTISISYFPKWTLSN
jgi:hypothetical protein